MTMRKGTNVFVSAAEIRVELGWRSGPSVPEVEASALLVTDEGKVRSDDDFVFRNRPQHASGAVSHEGGTPQGDARTDVLAVRLTRVEPGVDRIVLAASAGQGSFGDVPGLYVRLLDPAGHAELARFDSDDATVETAFVLGELYRKDGGWKFRAVGQGYGRGLAGLAEDFGIRVEADQAPSPGRMPDPPRSPDVPDLPEPPTLVAPSLSGPSLPAAPEVHGPPDVHSPLSVSAPRPETPSEPVDLGKVTLTKETPSVSLTKQGGTSGTLRVNLNWTAERHEQRKGLAGRLSRAMANLTGPDLDLCALYELADGRKGVVQALGDSFGSVSRPPWIHLDGDDRTGAVETGENLTVNLDHIRDLRRVLIFVTIYEGARSFAGLHATVTLQPQHGAPVDFKLDECTVASTVCALALLTVEDGELMVRREARYLVPAHGISPQRTIDQEYGWGMQWSPGRK